MISPGRYHEEVSRDLLKNLDQRRDLKAAARKDRQLQKRIVARCKSDILFYINLFAWQFDPSKARSGDQSVYPFITYPFQEDALLARPETHAHLRPYDRGILWCYENDRTMACEKSRWQGASWLFLIVQNWLCGFHDNVQTLNISRNENAVDDGTKNSLFWKLRYMQDRHPEWLMGEVEQSKLYCHFKRTGSEITGEASTAKAGVGGRASVIFVDEFPEIERGQEVREKTALTSNCRFFNGTHLGVGTPFQQMCDPRQSPEIVRWQMHWSAHPEQRRGLYAYNAAAPATPTFLDVGHEYRADYPYVLDGSPAGGPHPGVRSPWYDKKCAEIGNARAVAMNLDISPEGAAKQFFDGLRIRSVIEESARPPLWVGEILFDRGGRFDGIVQTDTGRLRLWVRPRADGTMPASRYCVGCDISAGTGATPSCAAGIDGDRSFKVLEYADPHIVEAEFARIVMAICTFLGDTEGQGAYLAWDSSGQQGEKFNNAIIELGYANVYFNDDDLTGFLRPKARKAGWYGSNKQKYSLLVDYRQALYDRTLTDRSEDCLRETLLFEYDKRTNVVRHAGEMRSNDPSGARENHGDMVIATGLAWMLAKEMAEGGRRSEAARSIYQPGTLEWLMALSQGRGREDDWA